MIGHNSITSGLLVYLVVTGLLHVTAHAKAVRTNGGIGFGPTGTIQFLVAALTLCFACAAIYSAHSSDVLGAIVFGVISSSGLFAFPSNIVVDGTGIVESTWWGRRKHI